jgi:hypothetical protein
VHSARRGLIEERESEKIDREARKHIKRRE